MANTDVLDIADISYASKDEALASKPVSIQQFRKALRASKLYDYDEVAAICLVLVLFDGGTPCVEDNNGKLLFFHVHGLSVAANEVASVAASEAPDA